jgi:glycosyltransferase involved in cell wall biosynthesis
MIAKNEEAMLPRVLSSLAAAPAITEVCVLDTGSTDRTGEVARDLGARVERWDGGNDQTGNLADFAAARNRSLAMGQNPWLMMVDADDILHIENPAADVASWLAEGLAGGMMAGYLTIHDGGHYRFQQARFLRAGAVKYVGRVHEFPQPSYPSKRWDAWYVEHLPDKRGKEGSDPRVLRILQAVAPRDRTVRDWFYLARSLWTSGYFGAGIDAFNEYLRRGPGFPEEGLFARYYLADCYEKLGERVRAKEVVCSAIAIDPRFAELHCYLGDLFYLDGHFRQARVCYEHAVQIGRPPEDSILFVDLTKYGDYPRSMLRRMGFEPA